MTGTVPPQNIEAEESVLGAMLVAESALTRVIDEVKLNAADFYLDRHRAIFECAHDLYAESKPVDELTVEAALTTEQRKTIASGRASAKHYVSDLAAKVPAAGNAKHYAEIVQRDADMRRVGEGLRLAAETYASRNGDSPEEIFERVADLVHEAKPKALLSQASSWHPCDLTDAIEGVDEAGPTILARSDGHHLLYDELIAQAAGEPEACKGWLAMAATAELLRADCAVVYFDFESTVGEIVQRLVAMGVETPRILENFRYVRPHEPLSELSRGELEAVLACQPALVVIDGVTEALTIHGLDLADNADIARWLELLPRPAARTGAAVLLIDHVVKDKESRGRYAIGAQHKLAGIDVAYSLEVVEPFGRGKDGLVKVMVRKDRPGHVRQHAEGDHIALMRLSSDAATGSVTVTLDPPDGVDESGEFKPTVLMERISRAIEAKPGMNAREVRELGGNGEALDQALKVLLADGFVSQAKSGRAHLHDHIRPFRIDTEEADRG